MGDRNDAYRVLVERPAGKRQYGRPRWEDSIKTHLQEIMNGIDMAQDRDRWREIENWVRNFRVI